MDKKAFWLVLAGAVLISFSPIFVKSVSIGPGGAAFYRCAFGALVLLPAAILRGERILPLSRLFLIMVLAAIFFSADLQCWHSSILLVGPGLATILANFQVFILAVFGAFFLKEALGIKHIIAMPLALVGLWMLIGGNAQGFSNDTIKGVALGLATACFYSGYILSLRHSQSGQEKLPAIANMGMISLLAAVVIFISLQWQNESLSITSRWDAIMLLLYGAGCQGLGWLLISSGLPRLPASRAGLIMLVQPVLSFIWDMLLFDRPTGALEISGAILAISAIYLGMASTKKTKASSC